MLCHEELYNTLMSDIKKSHSSGNVEVVTKAYQFALKAHQGQKRVSGEDYICHPLQVAIIISNMLLDCDTIAAGILHDTVEDTDITFHDLEIQFGKNVALMVDGVTKLGKIQFNTQEEAQIENLRKMFMSTARDLRVMLIKLADRLHNMRTMDVMPDYKRRQKSKETIEIFAPIAERLGMFKIKAELENFSLKYLDPIAYNEITSSLKGALLDNTNCISNITKVLEKKLEEINVKGTVTGRIKHVYSIFKKTYMQGKSIDEIYDIFAVRVIVPTVPECYAVLGVIHDLYKPIPGRIKDYIAMPKPNLYQSLHTTVIGNGGIPFEIQIRTEEMHRIAEYGIAAHWKYKDGIEKDKNEAKFTHLRELLELQGSLTDEEEFMQTLKTDIFADEVFVFTPKGEVISLPSGSCPIDFAYAIHSAIGSKMTGAKVNGKLVPLYYPLKNGDIVNIITSASVHGPSRDWLKIVRTSTARSKINQWFKREKRDENIVRGKEIFEKEIKKSGFSYSQLYDENIINQELDRNHFTSVDDLYAAIGYGGIPATKIVSKLRQQYKQQLALLSPEEKAAVLPHKVSSNGVIVTGIDNCLVRLSRCCNPVPGDDIIGYITRGRGVSVHRKDCINVKMNFVGEGETDRLIDVAWEEKPVASSYITEIHITADDRPNLLADIMVVISEFRIFTHNVNARVNKDMVSIVNLTVEINSSSQLDNLMKKLMGIRGVIQVSRTMQ